MNRDTDMRDEYDFSKSVRGQFYKPNAKFDMSIRVICHWCLKSVNSYIEIEGFKFCNESCEAEFYADKAERRTKGLPTLSQERKIAASKES